MSWSMGSMDMIPGAVAGGLFRVREDSQFHTFAAGMGLAACVRPKRYTTEGGGRKQVSNSLSKGMHGRTCIVCKAQSKAWQVVHACPSSCASAPHQLLPGQLHVWALAVGAHISALARKSEGQLSCEGALADPALPGQDQDLVLDVCHAPGDGHQVGIGALGRCGALCLVGASSTGGSLAGQLTVCAHTLCEAARASAAQSAFVPTHCTRYQASAASTVRVGRSLHQPASTLGCVGCLAQAVPSTGLLVAT